MNSAAIPDPARSTMSGVRARPQASWLVPVALVAVSAIPLTAGTLRLIQLAGGPAAIPADARFTGFPVALVVHIAGAAVFALGSVLQLVPRFRRKHLTWHRRSGHVLAVAGLMVAGSALWMTLMYTRKPGTGDVLYALRLLFVSAMVAAIVLGVRAARARNIPAHRAWMIRAYAIALAAGTQVFTEPLGGALFGTGNVRDDLAKGAGWVINLAVAEWAIRCRPRRSSSRRLRQPDRLRARRSTGMSTTTGTTTPATTNHGGSTANEPLAAALTRTIRTDRLALRPSTLGDTVGYALLADDWQPQAVALTYPGDLHDQHNHRLNHRPNRRHDQSPN
ncbi:DUF2306 domain-containing protein [Nocardioides sp. URHA0032]|uniref:DUF2306 domain-containing protein n=1 Tax=Nocardioides sp. URHA0032 TaxID=1380388 RepID=UPI000B0E3E47|nr:DUF2306 domain-containing protein [Nocardioides sp. URHA0032]